MPTLSARHWTQLDRVVALSVTTFIIQLLVSFRLWYPDGKRQFPMISLFEQLPLQFGDGINKLLIISLLASLILTGVSRWQRVSIPISLLIIAVLCLQDVLRIQAWVYQYAIMLGIAWGFYRQKNNDNNDSYYIGLLQLVFIATYFWSGFHKFNAHYPSVFKWMMKAFELTEPLATNHTLAYATAAFETLLAVGLLFGRTRKLAIVGAWGMHIFILALLIKEEWNYVVYAWNTLMMIGLYLLFWNQPLQISLAAAYKKVSFWLVSGLLVAPAFNIAGLWAYNTSMTMYSGMSLEVELVVEDDGTQCFPRFLLVDNEYNHESDTQLSLYLDNWTMTELAVPLYGETWLAHRLLTRFCPCMAAHDGFIRLEYSPRWNGEKIHEEIRCDTTK